MTPEQYRRVGDLYHAASELAPGARPDFLAKPCGGEDELRREVESLLRAHEQADGFIAGKASAVAELAARQQNLSFTPSLAQSVSVASCDARKYGDNPPMNPIRCSAGCCP